MRRFGFAFFLLLATQAPSFAGSVEDTPDGRTVITVSVYRLPDPSNALSAAQCEVVELFKTRFPKIFAEKYKARYMADPKKYGRHNWNKVEIRLEQATGITIPGSDTSMLSAVTGMSPDIQYSNFMSCDTQMRKGLIQPLDDYYATMSKEDIDRRVHPRIWPVIKRKGDDGKTHIWTLPFGGFLGKLIMYRKDLFKANDIPFPGVNWTWDDFMSAAKRITKPDDGVFGFNAGLSAYTFAPFLWSAGGDFMRYDEAKDEWLCIYDTPEAAVALDFYLRLTTEKWTDAKGNVHRGYTAIDSKDVSTKWEQGQIGMILGYIDNTTFSSINPDTVGLVPVPLGPTGLRGAELNSQMFAMSSQIKEPAVKDAAWEYMHFFDGKEANELGVRKLVESGMSGFVNPELLERHGYPELAKYAPKGLAEIYKIAFETGVPEPYGKNSRLAYKVFSEPIQEAAQMSYAGQLPEDREERLPVLQGILAKFCARANETMIGKISPEEKRKRNVVAACVLLATIIAFSFVMYRIMMIFSRNESASTKWQMRKYMPAYLLLAPAVVLILMWSYVPVVQGSMLAFYDYKLVGDSVFVGLENFANVLFNDQWWGTVWNSLRYCFIALTFTFFPPIVLAIFLQEVPRGKLAFRLIYYLPAMLTGIVTIMLWKQFFDPSRFGMLNAVVMSIPALGFIAIGAILFTVAAAFALRLGFHASYTAMTVSALAGLALFASFASVAWPLLSPISGESFSLWLNNLPTRLFHTLSEPCRWLQNPNTAMLSCVLPMVWAGLGPGSLIYLAALKGIPDDLYEASDIDGTTFIDKILFVVLPNMKVLIAINFVGAFIGAWYSGAGNILIMTGGMADTEVADLHIWYKAYTYLNFGEATAMAWMLGLMLIGFTIHQLKMLSAIEFKSSSGK